MIKILIVDDEQWLGRLLKMQFEEAGYKIFTATNLAATRTILNEIHPDIIILDVMLPDGNGIHFVKELRQRDDTRNAIIFLMSAHQTRSINKIDGIELGADDYLVKPFEFRELKSRMEHLLKRIDIAKPAPAAKKGLHEPSAQTPSLDNDHLGSALSNLLKPKTPALETPPKSTEPPPAKPTLSLKQRALTLFLRPENLTASWNDNEQIQLNAILMSLFGLGVGFQAGIQMKSIGSGMAGALIGSLGAGGLAALAAWLLHWGAGLKRIDIPFKPLFAAAGLGFAPLALAALLGALYVGFAKGNLGDFTAGALLFFPSQAASPTLSFFLRRADLFEIWGALLWAQALAPLLQVKFSRCAMALAGLWIVLIGLLGALKGAL